MMENDLDVWQCPLDGLNLIEASAGCGKTHAITRLWLRFVVQAGLSPKQILTVTFSEAATAELRGRLAATLDAAQAALAAAKDRLDHDPELSSGLRNLIEKVGRETLLARLQLAREDFEEAAIFTIHGFCRSLLDQEALLTGVNFEDQIAPDEDRILAEATYRFWRRWTPPLDAEVASALVSLGFGPEMLFELARQWSQRPELAFGGIDESALQRAASDPAETKQARAAALAMQALIQFLEEMKQEGGPEGVAGRLGLRTFRDLLNLVHRALCEPTKGEVLAAAISRRYPAALIDEFQDTDRIQWGVFRRLRPASALFLIGDPKQSIYRFRSADLPTYFEARDQAAAGGRLFELRESRRFSPAMADALNAIFADREGCSPPFLDGRLPSPVVRSAAAADAPEQKVEEPALRIVVVDDPDDSDQWSIGDLRQICMEHCASAIAAEISAGTAPDKIAVLLPRNKDAASMQALLRNRSVAASLRRSQSIFADRQATEMAALLGAIVTPADTRAARRAFLTNLWGATMAEICNESSLESHRRQLLQFAEEWRARGPLFAVQRLLRERQAFHRLAAGQVSRSDLNNALHLAELLSAAPAADPAGQLRWLETKAAAPDDEESARIRLEAERGSVSIFTVHSSKGLEFDSVHIPTFFGRKADRGIQVIDEALAGGGTAPRCVPPKNICKDAPWFDGRWARNAAVLAARQRLEEGLRLYYVALTRARRRLSIYWGRAKETLHVAGKSGMIASLAVDPPTHLLFWRPLSAGAAPPPKERAQFTAAAEALRRQSNERIVVHKAGATPPSAAPGLAAQHQEAPGALSIEVGPARIAAGLRWTSFSALQRIQNSAAAPEPEDDGVDRDQNAFWHAALDPGLSSASPSPSSPRRGAQGMHRFPAGAEAGVFLHSLIEAALRQSELTDANIDAAVDFALQQQGSIGNEALAEYGEALRAMLRNLVAAPLFDGFSLKQMSAGDRRPELRFQFPVSRDPDLFVNGAIDATVRVGQRYFLVDWKSNWLGAADEDYSAAAIAGAMERGGYLDQARIYGIALHRLLRRGMKDYDPEKHFGGALYVFLRGLRADGAGLHGVFHFRPEIEELEKEEFLPGGAL